MAKKKSDTPTYENAMTELQSIINDLQAESIGIDELSEKVKRAADLISFCKNKLRSTEIDIEKLIN